MQYRCTFCSIVSHQLTGNVFSRILKNSSIGVNMLFLHARSLFIIVTVSLCIILGVLLPRDCSSCRRRPLYCTHTVLLPLPVKADGRQQVLSENTSRALVTNETARARLAVHFFMSYTINTGLVTRY